MTKLEKKQWKRLKGKDERKPFLIMITERLAQRDDVKKRRWETVYRRKCVKKGVPCPLDKI